MGGCACARVECWLVFLCAALYSGREKGLRGGKGWVCRCCLQAGTMMSVLVDGPIWDERGR